MQAFLAERHVTGRERRQQGNAGFYSAVRLLFGERRLDRGRGHRRTHVPPLGATGRPEGSAAR